MDDAERAAQGMTVRREVLGDEHVDRAVAATTPLTAPFQDFITRYAWGEVWSRPGLSRAERSMITLTALVALRQEGELAMHLRAALRNGLTPDQIGEVLLHSAVYAGVPAANRAFAIARRCWRKPADRPAAPGRPAGIVRMTNGCTYRDHMVMMVSDSLYWCLLSWAGGYGGDRFTGRCRRTGRPRRGLGRDGRVHPPHPVRGRARGDPAAAA